MSIRIKVNKATDDDSEHIYNILKIFWKRGLILERSLEDIKKNVHQFFIARRNDAIAGVISYHDYGDHLKEIRSLVVKDPYSRKGVGTALLKTLIAYLRDKSNAKIFTLTYSPIFFSKNDFAAVNKETLPEKIWKDCINCRDAKSCGETAMVYSG